MQLPTEWDLSLLYLSDDDPKIKEDRETVLAQVARFVKKWEKNEEYLKTPSVMLEALTEYENLVAKHGSLNREGYYLGLRLALEEDNPTLLAMHNKYAEIEIGIGNDLNFFTHNISRVPRANQEKFLEYEPLANYKHYLERCFATGQYLLTNPEEKILNITGKTSSSNWVAMTSEFLAKETVKSVGEDGKSEERTLDQLGSLQQSQNKKVRDEAAKNFYKVIGKHVDVATKELNSILEHKKQVDKLRGFTKVDQETLIGDDIDHEVVDSLIEAVEKHFPISQKYYSLKAKLLDQKKIGYYERNVKIGEVTKKFPYDESRELVLDTFKSLDKEIFERAEAFFKEGRVDAFPRKGKSRGAFSIGVTIELPSYILLNHMNEVDDVTTIAHELGHGLNNEFMKRAQTELNFDHSTATAEVASTFFEDFVLERLKETADKEAQFTLLFEKLNRDISTIHRQIAAYKFERELHTTFNEEGYLPSERISEIFTKHMQSYLGSDVEMEKGAQIWWVYWPHIRNFFYVYSYASGLLISKSLQSMVKKNPKNIEKMKNFLSQGLNMSPKDLFLTMDIDISEPEFWQKGLKEVEDSLIEAEGLAKQLGKI